MSNLSNVRDSQQEELNNPSINSKENSTPEQQNPTEIDEVKELLNRLTNFTQIYWDRNFAHKNEINEMTQNAIKEQKRTQELNRVLWEKIKEVNEENKQLIKKAVKHSAESQEKAQQLIFETYQKNTEVMNKALEVVNQTTTRETRLTRKEKLQMTGFIAGASTLGSIILALVWALILK